MSCTTTRDIMDQSKQNTLIIKILFYIKPQSEEIQEKVQNLKKEIGSIYVWRAKSNNFLDMNLLYDE